MKIDRNMALASFEKYTNDYDATDPKTKLKIDHTYRVAELCQAIASSLSLTPEEVDLAWLCGLLHDIGRFEQLKRYNTFIDADSVDHAIFGASLLFEENLIRLFVEDDTKDEMLFHVIRAHSAFAVPEEYNEEEKTFCNILRDADKIDILRANIETPMEEIYNVTSDSLYNDPITPEVYQAFFKHETILRALKKTSIDHLIGHISLVFGLNYPISFLLVKKQGYLDQMMQFPSKNPDTLQMLKEISDEMNLYLSNKK